MHALSEGGILKVSLPRNNFALDATAGHTVLLAGGIGVTPLLGMAITLLMREKSFSFDYFGRSYEALAFADEIRQSALATRTRYHLGLAGEAAHQVLAARFDHRDMLLTEEEQLAGDRMLLCVSRSHDAELVLDL
jgi:vanillate O-demethylase ferredoxin subunit